MSETKQRVWAVWDGDDWYEAIEALFSSEERAKTYVKKRAQEERKDGYPRARRISTLTLDEE